MSDELMEEGTVKPDATSKKKKAVGVKAANVGSLFTSYEVKSKGYQETFVSMDDANKQADILRKRAVKNGEAVNIKVLATKQDDDKQHVVRNIKIDKSFFEN